MNFFEFLPQIPLLPEAKCKGIEDANIFFPESRQQERKTLPTIRKLCDGCIERKECLEYALDNEIPYGIWAGFTAEERRRMLNIRKSKTPRINYAEKVRALYLSGSSPKEIASALRVEHSYVTTVLKRAGAKLEGEIQSQLTDEKPGEESPSSSGFPQ